MPKQQRDIVKEALALFQQLKQRRIQLQRWLAEVDEALSTVRGPELSAYPAPAASATKKARRNGRGQNEMPLREAVTQAVGRRSLDRREILQEVGKLGYKFSGKNPMKSLDVFLYGTGKHLFKRVDGKFSLSGGTAKPAKKKRKMSAEGRKKISAAAKLRWAKVRAAKGK